MSEVKRYGLTWCEVTERTVFKHDQQDGEYVKLSDYASLQQKLDAVVADNAALKSIVVPISNLSQYGDIVAEMSEALRPHEVDGFVSIFSRARHIETPATDAILNAVRAEGIEILTDKLQQLIDEGTFDAKEIGVAAGAVHEGAQIAAELRAAAPKGDSDEVKP